MVMSAKLRNLLVLWLAFAVSPLSISAQTVCEFSCSFHKTTVRDPDLSNPKRNEALVYSVKQSDMHCHDQADSSGTHLRAFRNPKGACHRDTCGSPEVAPAASIIAQGKWSTPPTVVIAVGLFSAIPL